MQTPLEELIALPRPPSWFRGVPLGERKGGRGERREGKGGRGEKGRGRSPGMP